MSNLRRGFGSRNLASGGAVLRIGLGPIDAGAEVAVPPSRDRLDTGDRSARVSRRISIQLWTIVLHCECIVVD